MNYNRIIIGGHLTRDVELKMVGEYTVARFCVACSRHYSNRSGQKMEDTVFMDCDAWGELGKTIAKYFHKGLPILVDGKLKQSVWKADSGENRRRTFVAVDNFSFVAGKDDTQNATAAEPAGAPASEDVPF